MSTFYRISKLDLTLNPDDTVQAKGVVDKSDSAAGPWTKVDSFDDPIPSTSDVSTMNKNAIDLALAISNREQVSTDTFVEVIDDLDDQVFANYP